MIQFPLKSNLVLCNKSWSLSKTEGMPWDDIGQKDVLLLSIIYGTYPDQKTAAQQWQSNLATQVYRTKLGTIKPNEGKGEKSAMSITTGGKLPAFIVLGDCLVCIKEKETLNYYPGWHTSSSSRKPSYHSIKSVGGWVYLFQKNKNKKFKKSNVFCWDIKFNKSKPTKYLSITVLQFNCTIPYVHEAKSSDVRRVCVSDQTHHLFACQLESKQFIQKTESSWHNASSPNSTHLRRTKIVIYQPYHDYNICKRWLLDNNTMRTSMSQLLLVLTLPI